MNYLFLLLAFFTLGPEEIPQEKKTAKAKLEFVEVLMSADKDTVKCPIQQQTLELVEGQESDGVTMYSDAQTDIFYTFNLSSYSEANKGVKLEVGYYCTHYGLLQMKKKSKVFFFDDRKEISDVQFFEYHDRLANRTIYVSFRAKVAE